MGNCTTGVLFLVYFLHLVLHSAFYIHVHNMVAIQQKVKLLYVYIYVPKRLLMKHNVIITQERKTKYA